MAVGSDLEVISGKATGVNLGALSSGYSLSHSAPLKMVKGDSALAVLGSLPLTSGLAAGLLLGGLLSTSPILFLAPILVAATALPRMTIKRKQLREVFKSIEKDPTIDALVIHKVESEAKKFVSAERMSKFKDVRVFHVAFDNDLIARVFVYWKKWNDCIYEFEVYGRHETDRQIESWDDAFKTANAITD